LQEGHEALLGAALDRTLDTAPRVVARSEPLVALAARVAAVVDARHGHA